MANTDLWSRAQPLIYIHFNISFHLFVSLAACWLTSELRKLTVSGALASIISFLALKMFRLKHIWTVFPLPAQIKLVVGAYRMESREPVVSLLKHWCRQSSGIV